MRFSLDIICPTCHGRGKSSMEVDAGVVLLIVIHNLHKNGTVNKLKAIKKVRSEYCDIGLKKAKELVEGAIDYLEVIQQLASSIPTPESARSEYYAYEQDWRQD